MKTIGIVEFPYLSDRNYMLNQYKEWLSPHVNVVFIDYTIPIQLISKELDSLDGIVWPGGNIEDDKYHTDEAFLKYMHFIDYTYSYAKNRNKSKKFTIIGICLGFEILGLLCLEPKITLDYFDQLQITPKHGTSTLEFIPSFASKIFTKEEIKEMKETNVVMHSHAYGFNMKSQVVTHLKKCVTILSVDSFEKGDFVNMYQYKKYPFYGMMFHPEKLNNFVSQKLSFFFSKNL
jgi:anthranilate/para-aminobenzoate synthase component II